MRVVLHPAARSEILDSAQWYAERSQQASAAFAMAVDDAIASIVENPERHSFLEKPWRKCQLRRFPIGLVYRVSDGEVQIVAAMHEKRRP